MRSKVEQVCVTAIVGMLMVAGSVIAQPINLNPAAQIPGTPVVAADGQGHVSVVWPADPGVSTRIWDELYQAHSSDNGTSFGASSVHPYSGSSGYTRNLDPSLMYTSDGTLHLSWSYWDDTKGIVYSQSTDHGGTWTETIDTQLPETRGKYTRDFGAAMATADSGQTVRDIWYNGSGSSSERVYAGVSTDGGSSWTGSNITTDLQALSSTATPSATYSYMSSAVSDSQGNFYALSILGNTLSRIAVTHDAGGGWAHTEITTYPRTGSNVVQTHRGGNYMSTEHALAVDDGDTLYAVWSWDGDVLFSSSSDQATTWSAPTAVVDEGAIGEQFSPIIGLDNSGKLYMTWEDTRDGVAQLRMSTSIDGGLTWSPSMLVYGTGIAQESPDMYIASDDTIHFAWLEGGSPYYYNIPEPATMSLLIFGLGSVILRRRK